jgi:hypothetical protein
MYYKQTNNAWKQVEYENSCVLLQANAKVNENQVKNSGRRHLKPDQGRRLV